MKKSWRKLYRQEPLFDFTILGVLIFAGGGFLLYHIARIVSKSSLASGDIHSIELSLLAIFTVMLLSGVYLYKTSAACIRWYKNILDSIPMPVIITDKKAVLQTANKAAREIIGSGKDSTDEDMEFTHLISPDSGVMRKNWQSRGTQYRITGNGLRHENNDAGYLIFFDSTDGTADAFNTKRELLDEINRLFERLLTATDHFHNCTNGLAGFTVQQANIINGLSDVIAEIASGTLHNPEALNDKICAVNANMQRYIENGQANLDSVVKTAAELDLACDAIGDVLRNIKVFS